MKKLLLITLIIGATMIAKSAYSQVSIDVNLERSFPGYTYYTYPAWHGHYRDHAYYAHYQKTFERNHHAYIHSRQFDHDRYERDRREGRYHDHHGR